MPKYILIRFKLELRVRNKTTKTKKTVIKKIENITELKHAQLIRGDVRKVQTNKNY